MRILFCSDDKVARRFAESEALKVKGTLGIVADAAKAGLLNFRATVETLQQPQCTWTRTGMTHHRGIRKGAGKRQWQIIAARMDYITPKKPLPLPSNCTAIVLLKMLKGPG